MSKADNKFISKIKAGVLIGDGAIGTMIQELSSQSVDAPEKIMLENPDIIQDIHKRYINSGAELVETNTFGANRLKLTAVGLEDRIEEINTTAVKLARSAGDNVIVAGSVGPTGKLMEPHGQLAFVEAVDVFSEQISYLVKAGVDVVIIETMSDLKELRAAVIAAKQYDIPIIVQMTFTESGLTLTGSTPEVVAIVLENMGVDVVGINCVAGLSQAIPLIKSMSQVSSIPLSLFPNAGLPVCSNGQTIYPEGPQEFVENIEQLFNLNLRLIGGCCGTTPEYIKEIKQSFTKKKDNSPAEEQRKQAGENNNEEVEINQNKLYFSSNHKHIEVADNQPVRIIGEKLNPTGRDDLKKALRNNDWEYLRKIAKEQVIAGADLLDVNIGISGINKKEVMSQLVQELQLEVDVPLVLDSNDPEVIEAGLKEYTGKALVNSVNGDQEVMDEIFPIIKKYGAAVIGLTLDDKGIPSTVSGRFDIASRLVDEAKKYGIKRENVVIDTLVLTAGARQEEVLVATDTLKKVKEELGVKTTLGISNISHGLPGRELINGVFLSMALGAGIDLPILNPFAKHIHDIIRAANVLTGRDKDGEQFIKWNSLKEDIHKENNVMEVKKEDTGNKEAAKDTPFELIRQAVIKGDKNNIVELVKAVLEDKEAQSVVNKALIPGIEKVGELYDDGTYFLPQLMRSAETVQTGFDYLKSILTSDEEVKSRAKVLLATVKGDIHDIGKNIVKVIFANHGFEVVDLGADTAAETIVEKALSEDVDFVGLSALMTTTMEQMRIVVEKLRDNNYTGGIIIGGAVTSPEYAEEIGADIYAEDALDGVRKVNQYLSVLKG
ncbi:MAG: homocysteine S-methyltransferase family protein [Halothermotrichaceae bacterium]